MRALTIPEICTAMAGRLLGELTVPAVHRIVTDSRHDVTGGLFFALRGENHDGHAFVNNVLARGAACAVVSDLSTVADQFHRGGRVIQVPDVTAALGKLAGWYRRQFAAQVIAVVGSNGKTTTKDLIASVLGGKLRGKAAQGSFNNHIGVPLTLLSVEPADQYVVVEVGTNHPGEVAALGRMAQPDLAVVTSIGEEHLEFFGTLDAVASEEFSIVANLGGRAFLAMSEQAAAFAPGKLPERCTRLVYGFAESADLRATELSADRAGMRFRVNGKFDYRLPLIGRHNVVNALAAVAIGLRLKMTHGEIAAALETVRPAKMRLEPMQLGEWTVINDAYNANPTSMKAAFEAVDEWPAVGRRVFVLGDMRELGDESERCHASVGLEAGRSSAKVIIAVGGHSRAVVDGATKSAGTSKRIYAFPTVEALSGRLRELLEPGDIVLLKGSRGMRLERLLEGLDKRSPAATGAA